MQTVIKNDVPVTFGVYKTVGTIRHDRSRQILIFSDPEEPDQIISSFLDAYGLYPAEDGSTVFVKDWTENEGLTASLVAAGVVEVVRAFTVGEFSSRAFEVRVLGAAVGESDEDSAAQIKAA